MYNDQHGTSMRQRLYSGRCRVILCLLLALLSTGHVLAQTQAAPPTPIQASAAYRLQTGDTISVFYRLTPEYNQSLTILPDGSVDLRLLGHVHVDGLSAEQAQQVITAEAAKRLRDPEVSVSVTDFVRQQFTVMGEVGRPGRYEIHGVTTMAEALGVSGGFTALSAQKSVVLVRPLGPKSEYGNATVFDFKHLVKKNAMTTMPAIHDGDIIIVTTSKFAKLTGTLRLLNVGLYYNPASGF
ncbi:MAG: polysaccharide biosynthesis/export family protein [Janthinobacterium lividum]